MRSYENDYNRIMQQIRVKASAWRTATPSSPDYLRTIDNWRNELERLVQVQPDDARVKAALVLVEKIPAHDRRSAIKSLPDIVAVLADNAAAVATNEARQQAAIKALSFKSPFEDAPVEVQASKLSSAVPMSGIISRLRKAGFRTEMGRGGAFAVREDSQSPTVEKVSAIVRDFGDFRVEPRFNAVFVYPR